MKQHKIFSGHRVWSRLRRVAERCNLSRETRRLWLCGILLYALLLQIFHPLPLLAAGREPGLKQPVAAPPVAPPAQSEVVIYGPRRIDRALPVTRVTEQFTLPANTIGPYSLQVVNGAADGSNRALTLTVRVNGATVVDPGQFNLDVGTLTKAVQIAAANTIEIALTGRIGAFAAITITGRSGTPGTVPVITNFTPNEGSVGDVVTLNGTSLRAGTETPLAHFRGPNSTRVAAQVLSSTPTQARVAVPQGAVSGIIELATADGKALSPSPFTVRPSQNFTLTVAPSTVSAFQRSTATQIVAITNAPPNFSQLARLEVTGLPAGVNISFEPQNLTAGATSTLSLNLANINLAPGPYPFTISAVTTVDGVQSRQAVSSTLNVVQAGQTALTGRVLSMQNEPVVGATVSQNGRTATTDAAGIFLLVGVTVGNNVPIMVDGRTASAPGRTYPVIVEPANVVANQINTVPFTFYLPPIDTQHEVTVVPNQNTVVGNPRVTDLAMTVPANSNLRNLDGSPVTRTSITPVDPDRTPAPLPSNLATNMVYTSQPGGAVANVAIPVVYPNLAGAAANTRVELYYFNHNTVVWQRYGFGRVTADGRYIEPEIDPGTGRRYGLPDFSWHFPNAAPGGNPGDDDCPNISNLIESFNKLRDALNGDFSAGNSFGGEFGFSSKPAGNVGLPNAPIVASGPENSAPDPVGPLPNRDNGRDNSKVDTSTGLKLESVTDISLGGGGRSGLRLTRIHTSDLPNKCSNCAFGRGTTHNFDIRLTGDFAVNGSGYLILPAQVTGRLFRYNAARSTAVGVPVFTSTLTVGQLGDEIHRLSNGTFEYRQRDGFVLRFDANRRLVAILEPNGNTITLNYSGSNLTLLTDAGGRSITLAYDGSNRITTATDPLGRTWRYTYANVAGTVLTRVADPQNNVTNYGYAVGGRLASVTDGRGNMLKQITYDGQSRVIEQKFADQSFERYTYTLAGRMVSGVTITDSLGRTEHKRFNAAGYVTDYTDALGQTTHIERDMTANLPLSRTGPCRCAEGTFVYDERGNLLQFKDRLNQEMRFEYEPALNRLTRKTDPLGRVTNYAYDARGNLVSATDALGRVSLYTYDGLGQLTSLTDPLGHSRHLTYDAQGNAVTFRNALNQTSTFEYDAVGRLRAAVDPLGRRTAFVYDDLDRLTSSTSPAGVVSRLEYDPNGNPTDFLNALNQRWTNSYDARNRLVSRTDPLGRRSRWRYNTDNQVTAFVSPSGRATTYTYDARGQLATVTTPQGFVLRLVYDNNRNLVSFTDERGQATTFVYDEVSRLTGMRDPLGQTTTFSYNAAGSLTGRVDRLGRSTAYAYDALNRLTQAQYADATVTYQYDPAYRLTQVTDTQDGTLQWAYDDANRIVSETAAQGVVVYTYNAAGQRSAMTVANRPPVNYTYDTAGRLAAIAQGSETFTYGYDTLSRVASLQRPNGVRTAYQYDNASRLARLTHTNAASQILEDFQYGYTAEDALESITSLASAQLLPAAGNAAPADAANRLRQFGANRYDFDNQGQTITRATAANVANLTWDARGRLTRATLNNGQNVDYGYDALGRRTRRTVGGTTTSFVYDKDDVVADSSSGGATDYLNGRGLDNKLRQSGVATGSLYFLTDHLRSTAALTNSSGGVVERMQYEAYGASAGSAFTRYGYTGRERDETTGLMFYRARWYDTQQGRFLTEDPLGLRGGDANLYNYVRNGPVHRIDPTGQVLQLFLLAGEALAIGAAVGGSVALLGQALSDLVCGKLSSQDKYVSVGLGGAVGGAFRSPIGGAAVGDVVQQTIQNGFDYVARNFGFDPGRKQSGFDLGSPLTSALQAGINLPPSADLGVSVARDVVERIPDLEQE